MVEDKGGYLWSMFPILGLGFATFVDGKGEPDLSERGGLVEFDDLLHAGLHLESLEIFRFGDGLIRVFQVWSDVRLASCFGFGAG